MKYASWILSIVLVGCLCGKVAAEQFASFMNLNPKQSVAQKTTKSDKPNS